MFLLEFVIIVTQYVFMTRVTRDHSECITRECGGFFVIVAGKICGPLPRIDKIWMPPSGDWQNLGTPPPNTFFNSPICLLLTYVSYFSVLDN